MIPIPVEIDAILSILNLPKEMSNNGIFKEHQGLVMEMIHSLVLQEHYDRATHDDMQEEESFLISFRFGFAFLMLHSTAEFLNLKTLGEGIVKTVGLDQSATELLTGSEIDAFKANLELRHSPSCIPTSILLVWIAGTNSSQDSRVLSGWE